MHPIKILAISDQVVPTIESPHIRERFGDVAMVLGCGDLPYLYMEYVASMLNLPCLYVHGNHDRPQHLSTGQVLTEPGGWENVDARVVDVNGWIVGGLEGSQRYRPNAPYQYTEQAYKYKIWRMSLSMLLNRLLKGRYLDILITHAPPCGIHDEVDACHQGFQALLTFMKRFRPRYLLHGHIHRYGNEAWRTQYLDTEVINVFPSRVIELRTNGNR
jgi:Icc-related predicted phosphoesterase